MNKSAQIGRYVYSTRAIGKGAFSRVYKGFDIDSDEIVAIKIIDKMQLRDSLVDKLYEEISLLSKLQHPGVAELRDFLNDEENFYLILEYCAGGDLSGLIKKGKIEEDVARNYMYQLVDVLRYLKSINIIHRDLKPQNILLSADFQTIKVTDFNFARELYDNDLADTMCGSPLYMAPEIIEKQEYTVKSDLWSVGMILYEMVYGKHPYSDSYNIIDLLKKIKERPINYKNSISPECNDLINKLLQKNPIDRIDWQDFFAHPWLQIDEPTFLPSEQEHMWESISLSTMPPKSIPRSEPRGIPNRFKPDLVDNYVPLGTSPPRFTRSEPIDIFRASPPPHQSALMGSDSAFSAPEPKSVLDNLWSYMSNSATVIKGAVDYISDSNKDQTFGSWR